MGDTNSPARVEKNDHKYMVMTETAERELKKRATNNCTLLFMPRTRLRITKRETVYLA